MKPTVKIHLQVVSSCMGSITPVSKDLAPPSSGRSLHVSSDVTMSNAIFFSLALKSGATCKWQEKKTAGACLKERLQWFPGITG